MELIKMSENKENKCPRGFDFGTDNCYYCDYSECVDWEEYNDEDDDYQADQAQMQAGDYYEGNRERFD